MNSGQELGHTLLFSILISLTGLYLYQHYRQFWLSIFAFGTMLHLILDQMWQTPETILWPVFGFTFLREDITGWLQDTLQALLTNPAVYVPEIIGMGIIVLFSWFLLRNKQTLTFIKTGKIV